LRERFSEKYAAPKSKNGVYRRRYNHELDKEFDSPNAINVTKTSRFRYSGHMIRGLEDQPQKANPRKTEIQVGRWDEQ
jgi:hypothetical protein